MFARLSKLIQTPFGLSIVLAYIDIACNASGLAIDFIITMHDDYHVIPSHPVAYGLIFLSIIVVFLISCSAFFINHKCYKMYTDYGIEAHEAEIMREYLSNPNK